ncbi:MAG: hypothetical protein NVSMB32_03090 [Actinomycetota bacterium]
MKRLVLRGVILVSTVASIAGVGTASAGSRTIDSNGCVDWSASQGCIARQSCSVDPVARTWYCINWATLDVTGGDF